jgi:alpha-amylase
MKSYTLSNAFALLCIIVVIVHAKKIGTIQDLPGCQVFQDNHCSGNQINSNASMNERRWFTPARNEEGYLESFQDYSHLVGYSVVQYTDVTKTAATVIIKATHKDSVPLTYVFDNTITTNSNSMIFTAKNFSDKVLQIMVKGSDGTVLNLEPIDFHWNLQSLPTTLSKNYRNGQKGAIVEMFGWPDKDIEEECTFLSENGYMGVKIYPHQEQVMATEPFQNLLNPWYFMYQPVSYRLNGRMGSRDDLRTLISTCRKLGVRVYADAVVNHMTGGGNDMGLHRNQAGGTCVKWGNKSSSLGASGPSPYYTQDFVYATKKSNNLPQSNEFPAAGYGPLDFHCERPLNSWDDPLDLNAGWLTGLVDLNTELDHVQERIAAYMTDLIGIGISGFRVDAAKHMKPDDLVAIFLKFKRNMGGTLPDDFITWWEILLGGESDLLMCNSDSGYNYGGYLIKQLQTAGFSSTDIDKIKIWNSGYPKETAKGLVNCDQNSPKIRSVIQNDDADQQNPGSSSRDMGNDGCVLIKGCSVDEHRAFEVKLFTSPNGAQDNDNDFPIRVVLSSFYWYGNGLQGIPDGKSDCSLCTTNCDTCQSVPKTQAYDGTSKGYDMTGYTRVHRDQSIIQAMRKWMGF